MTEFDLMLNDLNFWLNQDNNKSLNNEFNNITESLLSLAESNSFEYYSTGVGNLLQNDLQLYNIVESRAVWQNLT